MQEQYEQAHKKIPPAGYMVETPDGKGVVTECNIFKETVKVRLEDESHTVKSYIIPMSNHWANLKIGMKARISARNAGLKKILEFL